MMNPYQTGENQDTCAIGAQVTPQASGVIEDLSCSDLNATIEEATRMMLGPALALNACTNITARQGLMHSALQTCIEASNLPALDAAVRTLAERAAELGRAAAEAIRLDTWDRRPTVVQRPLMCWMPDRTAWCEYIHRSEPDHPSVERAIECKEDRQQENDEIENRMMFFRAGKSWVVGSEGDRRVVEHRRGFEHIRLALLNPGRGCDCRDVLAEELPESDFRPEVSFQPLADSQALHQYKEKYHALKRGMDEAEENNDPAQRELIQRQMAELVKRIRSVQTPGGATKSFVRERDKARQSVRKAVRRALKYLRDAHPTLYDHLHRYLRIKPLLIYDPPDPVSWEL